jgi:hypothetical protein
VGFAVGKRVPTGAERTKKMVERLNASGNAWQEGSLAPKKHPISAGLAASGKHKTRTMEALNEGRYEQGLKNVDEGQMVAAIMATPSSAVVEGVQRRLAKTTARQEKLAQLQTADAAVIDAMPQDTADQRRARMNKQFELGSTLAKRMRS